MLKSVEESGSGCVSADSDIFFGKEKFSSSSDLGNERENKTGDSHQPANPPIVHTVFGRCSRHSFLPWVVSE